MIVRDPLGAEAAMAAALKKYAYPADAEVVEVGTGGNTGKVKVRLPGELTPTADLPWAPVVGSVPAVSDRVLAFIEFASRRVITGGTGGVGGAVDSVFGRTGAVVAVSGDYTATQITNTPAGSIAAVTVQAAITELDADHTAHLNDTVDAHDASAISYAGGTGMSATDAEGAIDELATEKLDATSYTAADVLTKLLTVDGSGSNLDADKLDGQDSAAFVEVAGDTMSGDLNFGDTNSLVRKRGTGSISVESLTQFAMICSRTGAYLASNAYWDGTNWMRRDTAAAAAAIGPEPSTGAPTFYLAGAGANPITWTSSKVWHAGNDGAASTLDADLVDGLHAASFELVSNKGIANGYASLGAGGLVPMSQLASGTPDGTKFVRDDGTLVTPSGSNYRTLVTLAADRTNSATTFADATGLSFAVVSGTVYRFEALIWYTVNAITVGSRFAINGPAMTRVAYTVSSPISGLAIGGGGAGALDGTSTTAASGAHVDNAALIYGIVQPSANGTVIVRFAPETATLMTVRTGSTLEYW